VGWEAAGGFLDEFFTPPMPRVRKVTALQIFFWGLGARRGEEQITTAVTLRIPSC
jgi:hypothetical protein